MLQSMLGNKKSVPIFMLGEEKERVDIIAYRLNRHMQEHKPFLKPGYRLRDLSEEVQMPLHQLSAFLNRRLGMHFTDFLNEFRIQYCIDLMQKELEAKANLKEFVSKCGFHNRNTFRTAFKKFTGQTPSQYLRSLSRM